MPQTWPRPVKEAVEAVEQHHFEKAFWASPQGVEERVPAKDRPPAPRPTRLRFSPAPSGLPMPTAPTRFAQGGSVTVSDPIGPAGRTFSEVTGKPYLSVAEREWYLKEAARRAGGTVTHFEPDAQEFILPRIAEDIAAGAEFAFGTLPSAISTALQSRQPPQTVAPGPPPDPALMTRGLDPGLLSRARASTGASLAPQYPLPAGPLTAQAQSAQAMAPQELASLGPGAERAFDPVTQVMDEMRRQGLDRGLTWQELYEIATERVRRGGGAEGALETLAGIEERQHGTTVGSLVLESLPFTGAAAAIRGAGLLPNLLGRGSLSMPRFLATELGAEIGAVTAPAVARELGASPEVQIAAGLGGGLLGGLGGLALTVPVRSAQPPPGTLRPTVIVPPVSDTPEAGLLGSMLGVRQVQPTLTPVDHVLNAVKRITGYGIPVEPSATPIMRERARVLDNVLSVATAEREAVQRLISESFDLDAQYRIRRLGATLADVAADYDRYVREGLLLPEERAALEEIRNILEPYRRLLQEAGIDVATRADIQPGGFYIPRGRATAEGADAPMRVPGRGRHPGSRKGFERGAVFRTQQEGIEAGYEYAAPHDAIGTYIEDAGTRALDADTAAKLIQLVDENGLPVALSPNARLMRQNPDLAQRIADLRREVVLLQRGLRGVTTRAARTLERFAAGDVEVTPEQLQDALAQLRVAVHPARRREARRTRAELGTRLHDIRVTLKELEADWQRALKRSQETPRGAGRVDIANLQSYTFPEAVAEAINKEIRKGMQTGVAQLIKELNSILRMIRSTADLSWFGMQGIIVSAAKPHVALSLLRTSLRAIGDPAVIGAYIRKFDRQASRRGLPTARQWAARGLHVGGVQRTEFTGQGSGRIGEIVGGAPVIRHTNRAFAAAGDIARLDRAQNSLDFRLKGAKYDPNNPDHVRLAEDIAESWNRATGWSRGRFLGDVGDIVLFAPRLFMSQLEMIVRSASPFGNQRQANMARRQLLGMVSTISGMTYIFNEALGNEDFNYWSPTIDGRINPNFMRVRIPDDVPVFGGRDYSLFGPWDSLVKAIAFTIQGDHDYLARTKASPSLSMAWDLISGSTFMGEDAYDPEVFMANSILPFAASDIYGEGDIAALGGFKSSPITPSERLEQLSRKLIPTANRAGIWPEGMIPEGADYFDLTSRERQAFAEWASVHDPELVPIIVERERQLRERGSVFAKARAEEEQFWADRETQLNDMAAGLLSGEASPTAVREAIQRLRVEARAPYTRPEYVEAVKNLPSTDIHKLIDAFYGLPDHFQVAGLVDWETVERKRAQLIAAVEEHDESLGARLRFNTERRDVPSDHNLLRLYDRAQIDVAAYYSLPDDPEQRIRFREQNPRVDFSLWLFGYVSTVRSEEARRLAESVSQGRPVKLADK